MASYFEKASTWTKSALNSTAANIGQGLASGAANQTKQELQTLVQPDGPLGTQLKNSIEQALTKQAPVELVQLHNLLQKFLTDMEDATLEEITEASGIFQKLFDENDRSLLLPNMTEDEMALCKRLAASFEDCAPSLKVEEDPKVSTETESDSDDLFVTDSSDDDAYVTDNDDDDSEEVKVESEPLSNLFNRHILASDLRDFLALYPRILEKNQGSLINAANHLQKTFFEDEKGIVHQTVHILEKKCNDAGDQLTSQAHPVLCQLRATFLDLQHAVMFKNPDLIKKHAKLLRSFFDQLFLLEKLIFTKEPLKAKHLNELIGFRDSLSEFYKNPGIDYVSMQLFLEHPLKIINRYYNRHAGIAARTGDIVRDTVAQAGTAIENSLTPVLNSSLNQIKDLLGRIEKLPERVEKMPRGMVDNLLGRAPTLDMRAGPEEGTEPAENGIVENTAADFLVKGSAALKKLLDFGKDSLSQPLLCAIAKTLSSGLLVVYNKMENTPTFAEARGRLDSVLRALQDIQDNRKLVKADWTDLSEQLERAADVLKGMKIYVNGFRLPNLSSHSKNIQRTAELFFADNMATLQKTLQDQPTEAENQDWKAKALDATNTVIFRQAHYLTMKHIFESICELTPDSENFYLVFLKKAQQEEDPEAAIKEFFFDELSKHNLSYLTIIWSHISYFFYGGLVKSLTERASMIYLNEVFDYIEKNKTNEYADVRDGVITNFTRFLNILNIAYCNVAKHGEIKQSDSDEILGTIDEMLKRELEKPKSNLRFETNELYLAFAQNVIEKTLNAFKLSWFTSLLLKLARRWVGEPEDIIRSTIDKATGSIKDTAGYTHALNCVLLEQLNDVWRLMQNQDTTDQNSSLNNLSKGKKAQLSALLENLFVVLPKSKCSNVDELRDLIKGQSLVAKANKAVEELFIEEVLEKVTEILGLTMQTLMKEDQLQKLTYKFASLINRTYEVGEAVTKKEMQEVERNISKRSEQILRLAINSAVENHFDFTGVKEQTEANRYSSQLHEESQKYFTTVARDLKLIETMDMHTEEAQIKISKILEEANAYQSECYEANFQAKTSKLNADNKEEIAERYLTIGKQSQPFVQSISDFVTHARTLQHHQIAAPLFAKMHAELSAIGIHLFTPSFFREDTLKIADDFIQQFEANLEQLKKIPTLTEHVKEISGQIQIIASIIVQVRKAYLTKKLHTDSRLRALTEAKKRTLGNLAMDSSLRAQFAEYKGSILAAINDDHTKASLIRSLKTIQESKESSEIDRAKDEMMRILTQTLTDDETVLRDQQQKYWIAFGTIQSSVENCSLMNPDQIENTERAFKASIKTAQNQLQKLAEWEESHIRQIPYINFNPLDMKELQDWSSGIVYSRVRERLDGTFDFFKREDTYRYGILNHLFLIPYLQKEKALKV